MTEYSRGEASIDKELVSNKNKHLVLHDSRGFEAADDEYFNVVDRFLKERRCRESLKDRLHAIW